MFFNSFDFEKRELESYFLEKLAVGKLDNLVQNKGDQIGYEKQRGTSM